MEKKMSEFYESDFGFPPEHEPVLAEFVDRVYRHVVGDLLNCKSLHGARRMLATLNTLPALFGLKYYARRYRKMPSFEQWYQGFLYATEGKCKRKLRDSIKHWLSVADFVHKEYLKKREQILQLASQYGQPIKVYVPLDWDGGLPDTVEEYDDGSKLIFYRKQRNEKGIEWETLSVILEKKKRLRQF
jgi:hypothetical protein